MLRRIETAENIPDFLEGVKNREERLMGFGHRVYKNYDPRARIIKKNVDEVLEATGDNPLLDIATELEKRALDDEFFTERKLYPNVDFYSGLIYEALRIPTEMFTVIFAIPRTSGWVAQWLEMIDDPEQKIARPRQIYTGERDRTTSPIDAARGAREDHRPAGAPAEAPAARRLSTWRGWRLTARHGPKVVTRALRRPRRRRSRRLERHVERDARPRAPLPPVEAFRDLRARGAGPRPARGHRPRASCGARGGARRDGRRRARPLPRARSARSRLEPDGGQSPSTRSRGAVGWGAVAAETKPEPKLELGREEEGVEVGRRVGCRAGAEPPLRRVRQRRSPAARAPTTPCAGDEIVFTRPIVKEGKVSGVRWLAMLLGLFGTYRKHEVVDVEYRLGATVKLASDVEVEPDVAPRGRPASASW